MLGAHSRLSCGPETHFFHKYFTKAKAKWVCDKNLWPENAVKFIFSLPKQMDKSIPENYGINESKIRTYLEKYRPSIPVILSSLTQQYMQSIGKKRWVEKTPNHLYDVDKIRHYFPKSPIIRIIRDPRDVALSLEKMPWGPNSFLNALLLCKEYYDRSWKFFKKDKRTYTIYYEDLIISPEMELKKLCNFLHEEFEGEMLNTRHSLAHVNRANEPWKQKIDSPLDRNRVYYWKRELTEEKNHIAECILGDYLAMHRYSLRNKFSKFVHIYPFSRNLINDYPSILESLVERQFGICGVHSSNRSCLYLYVGDPDKNGWLGFTSRTRLLNTVGITIRILKARIKREQVHWLHRSSCNLKTGCCNRILSMFLTKISTDLE